MELLDRIYQLAHKLENLGIEEGYLIHQEVKYMQKSLTEEIALTESLRAQLSKPQPTSQDWFETIKELQKFTDELGIIGMVGSLAWKARIKQAITNEWIEKPRPTSQEVLDAERWNYYIEICSHEAAFELTGITDASNEQINSAIDAKMKQSK